MYETKHTDGSKRRIDYTVWSEVFTCPECGSELTFTEEATDEDTGGVKAEFPCPHCTAPLTKRKLDRVLEATIDPVLKTPWKRVKFKPCLIQYRVGKVKHEKVPDQSDLALLTKIENLPWPSIIPSNRWPIEQMYHGSRIEPKGFSHTHQFFLPRAAQSLGALWLKAEQHRDGRIRQMLLFFVEQAIWGLSRMNRYSPSHFSQVNRTLSGVYYIASQHSECSPWYVLDGKLDRLASVFRLTRFNREISLINTGSADALTLPDGCLDYIFTDPPFGENIPYSDLNLLIESWHGVATQTKTEAIIDAPKGKELPEYQGLMLGCFQEFYRILKPGRWMTVEFSNSQAAVWNSIHTTLQQAGFVVANVAALDKQQRSFRSVTTTTAVKQDLVISAYKPNGGLEDRFAKTGSTVAGVWDFVRTHLKNLPVVKIKGGQLVPIAERDPRILHDRMIAFYLGHSTPVPLSSAEFQLGLGEHFVERDEKWYLPEQAHLYDQKRLQMDSVGQLAIFVEDERTAIDWVRQYIKERPSTSGDITPDFMQQLSASWKKWEARPELRVLLDQNFLCYDGVGEVPSQIHSYLSTQFKELRNLDKDHAQLRHKAKDRWYVPDPKKNIDVETLRNKRLLEEFWLYLPEGYISAARNPDKAPTLPGMAAATPRPKVPRSKKLREVRTEAIRVGFKYCYQSKDYYTILAVADMLPESVLNEDEQLQMLYDNAALRSGASAS